MATTPICNPHICRVLNGTAGYCWLLMGTGEYLVVLGCTGEVSRGTGGIAGYCGILCDSVETAHLAILLFGDYSLYGRRPTGSKQIDGYISRKIFILSVTAELLDVCPLGRTRHIDKIRQVQKYCLRAPQGSNITK